LRDEKVKVFRAMRPLDPAEVVRGQVEGYRAQPGVADDSDTETFAAMRLDIDSWRWSGVPFYIRAGKALAATVTEAVVEFKQPPRLLFSEEDHVPDPCRLRFRMKPDDMITLTMQAKVPGLELVSQSVDMTVNYERPQHRLPDAYERLIADAFVGDQRLFTRQDGVEQAWRVVDPILGSTEPAKLYRAGSWGPDEARRFVPPGCGDV
jgi:glucose-6-phosphate 1-dehydrogenase